MVTVLQKPLFKQEYLEFIDFENPYFTSDLITYIGNKRRLLPFLNRAFLDVWRKLGKKKLRILDGFSGSGVVSRLLKYYSKELYVNDLEDYCETINKCYLANESDVDLEYINKKIEWLNNNKLDIKEQGFIELNYAPKNDLNVKPGERVFYTNRNAKIIDNVRRLISRLPKLERHYFLAPLLVKASIHTNTSGVFKGFHKRNGVGHFGGNGENALLRIKGEISLDTPIFSNVECKVFMSKKDINSLVKDKNIPSFDLVYYDPPYNQHPYGSNYFMLNLINNYEPTEIQDGISGIAKHWNRSDYNKYGEAEKALDDLIENTESKFIVFSYNNEGIIPVNDFKKILQRHGKYELYTQEYNTYRGSRNLKNRDIKVTECLWVLEKR